jgi:hypothetical protein
MRPGDNDIGDEIRADIPDSKEVLLARGQGSGVSSRQNLPDGRSFYYIMFVLMKNIASSGLIKIKSAPADLTFN